MHEYLKDAFECHLLESGEQLKFQMLTLPGSFHGESAELLLSKRSRITD